MLRFPVSLDNLLESIPIDEKNLIQTAGQIFNKHGPYRDLLFRFIESSPEEGMKQKQYILDQIAMIDLCAKDEKKTTVMRQLTHQRKVIKVDVQIYWTHRGTREWCVVGEHLQEIFRFLPKAIHRSGETISGLVARYPKTGTRNSKWYPVDNNYMIMTRIAFELRMLQLYVLHSEQRVQKRTFIESIDKRLSTTSADSCVNVADPADSVNPANPGTVCVCPLSQSHQGILDLDIPVDHQAVAVFDTKMQTSFCQLIKLFYRNRGNPYKLSHGVYIYNKNGISLDVMKNLVDRILQPIGSIIYPRLINFGQTEQNRMTFECQLKEMFQDPTKSMGLMVVDRHAMFWVKNNNTWYLCDPWKKYLSSTSMSDIITNLIDETNDKTASSKWMFLSRKYSEQYKTEGSCCIAAISRILQLVVTGYNPLCLADEFMRLITEPIYDWTAMLSSCIVRHLGKGNK